MPLRGRVSALAGLLALFAGTTSLVLLDARPAAAQFGMGIRGFGMHGARGRPNFVGPGRISGMNQAARIPNIRMMPQGPRMPGGMGRVDGNPDMAIGRGTPGCGPGRTTYVPGRGPGGGPVVTIPRRPVAEVPHKPRGPVAGFRTGHVARSWRFRMGRVARSWRFRAGRVGWTSVWAGASASVCRPVVPVRRPVAVGEVACRPLVADLAAVVVAPRPPRLRQQPAWRPMP